jgi:glycosyltransferase involved in cell wall biosynthesis
MFTDAAVFGGAERALLMLLAHLDQRRWLPTLVYNPTPEIVSLEQGAADLGVPLCPLPPLPFGREGLQRLPSFTRFLRQRRPGVFHAHLSWPLAAKFPLAAAVVARVPSIATVQLYPEVMFDRSSRLQLRLLSVGVDRYIAVSSGVAERLVRKLGVPAEKTVVIPNAVDVERFSNVTAAELRRNLAGDAHLVLSLARLHEQKGLDVLLRAAVELPDARFVLAGEGPERGRLERLARQLGIAERVVLLGTRRDTPELLAACDVLALPSRYEGLPLVLLEAMAAGVPLVASNIPGVDELIVSGENGLLVEPGDPGALAREIRRLLDDRELRRQLALRARATVEQRYAAAAIAERVMSEYDALAKRASRR